MSNYKQQFNQRINDGRKVWLNGEIVHRLDTHEAFSGTIHTIQSLLDLQQDEQYASSLLYETEDQTNAHLSFLVPNMKEDLVRKRQAYKIWADQTFGIMSRLSEYSRSLFTGWYANRSLLDRSVPGVEQKIVNLYKKSRDFDLLSTAAAQDPQRNRSGEKLELEAGYLRIVKKTEDGVIVRGAKSIATSAPYVDEFLITSFHKRSEAEKDGANLFFIPASLDGLHIVCRDSFASNRVEDRPLSARFDEMDAVLIFEDVLIPWENVLVHEDPDLVWHFRNDPASGLLSQHQTVTRLVSKLETTAAIGQALAKEAGAISFLHVKEKLAELIIQIETIKSLLIASEETAFKQNDVVLPNGKFLTTARNLGTRYYPRAIEILQQIGAGGLLQIPSTFKELDGPIGHLLKDYYSGTESDAYKRTQLMKIAWDLIGSELGARQELYERFYTGDPVRTFAQEYLHHPNKQNFLEFAYKSIK